METAEIKTQWEEIKAFFASAEKDEKRKLFGLTVRVVAPNILKLDSDSIYISCSYSDSNGPCLTFHSKLYDDKKIYDFYSSIYERDNVDIVSEFIKKLIWTNYDFSVKEIAS